MLYMLIFLLLQCTTISGEKKKLHVLNHHFMSSKTDHRDVFQKTYSWRAYHVKKEAMEPFLCVQKLFPCEQKCWNFTGQKVTCMYLWYAFPRFGETGVYLDSFGVYLMTLFGRKRFSGKALIWPCGLVAFVMSWIYFLPVPYHSNPWWFFKKTLNRCWTLW